MLEGGRLWCALDVADIRDRDEELFGYVEALSGNEGGLEALTMRAGGAAAAWLFARGVRLLVLPWRGEAVR